MSAELTELPVLEARRITKVYRQRRGFRPGEDSEAGQERTATVAVDDVDLEVLDGETLAIIGESGSGKSTLARCLVRLETPTSGAIILRGRDITSASRRSLRAIRRELQVVFQDPYSSLNPRRRIGEIVAGPLQIHRLASREEARRRAIETLDLVGLSARYFGQYPHQLSGGQRQRAAIARALVLRPRIIVADEPVSALDVSIQAQILNLLQDLQDEFGLTYVFIAHDLAVVRHLASRIAVMRHGRIVELGDAEQVCQQPQHAYTRELLAASPIPDPTVRQWEAIAGSVESSAAVSKDASSDQHETSSVARANTSAASQSPRLRYDDADP